MSPLVLTVSFLLLLLLFLLFCFVFVVVVVAAAAAVVLLVFFPGLSVKPGRMLKRKLEKENFAPFDERVKTRNP